MSTEYLGPFDLELDIIEANVVRSGPGTFRLGHNDVWGQLSIRFIGRSDDDLKGELRRQAIKKKYTRFMFQSADKSRQAFERHCREYHKYRGNGYLDNAKHPIVPSHHEIPCPICKKIVLPTSTEKPEIDPKAKKKSSGMVLKLADEVEVETNFKPWEIDDEGNKIRRSIGDGEEARPWNFDDPNLVALDVEEMVKADKQLTEQKPEDEEEEAKTEEKKPVLPSWLAEEDESFVPPEETKKPWEIDDEDGEPPKESKNPKDTKKPWESDEES